MSKEVDNVNHKDLPADDGVIELVHAVMHAFRSQQYRAIEHPEHGITHMEAKVLGFFARHAGATQSDLVLHSGRDKAQLARLIKGLRERGLLDGVADAADRRSVCLHLTDAGRVLQRTLRQGGRKLEAQALAGLSDFDRRELGRLLTKIRENLEAG